jgi:iron complex transport system substrate-binding protein
MSASPRVVSLLPSATEMVAALGMREALVGVSHECDFPAEVAGLPVMTRTTLRSLPRSADIDRDVRRLLKDVLAVYELELDRLREARPDVIVTQDLCDVCAVSFDDVCRAARELGSPDLRIVNLHPKRLGDVWNDIRRVAGALGREQEAEGLLADIAERVEAVRSRAADAASRPDVLTIEWLDPVMVGGTWMPELVELAGGRPLVTRPGDHAPTLELARLRELAPEVVLFKPCGFDLERTRAERCVIDELLAAVDWPAVREGRVWIADGNAFFNRPGPRLVDSLEILAACVHPDRFEDLARRHEGSFERLQIG